MKFKQQVSLFLASFSCFIFCKVNAYSQSAKSRPNVIIIYADDLGYGETGVYGQTKIRTPYIDRLAKEGLQFTQFYSGSPVCAPARCIMLTGKHSGHAYIRGNYELGGFADSQEGGQMPLPEGTFTIAHMLKKQGYSTGAVGKWGLGIYGSTGSPDNMGFDYFYGYLDQKQAHNHYPTHLWENGRWDSLGNKEVYVHHSLADDINEPDSFNQFTGKIYAEKMMLLKTDSFIAKKALKPFFLYLPFSLPHLSLQAPFNTVNNYRTEFKEEPYRGRNGYASTLYPHSTYAAMITYLDSMVGAVFSYLKKYHLEKNTIVFFTSDNGATFQTGGFDTSFFKSNGPLRGAKQDVYEGGIRVPMIAWWPGKIQPGTTSVRAWQVDFMETFAEIAGAETPKADGSSMIPILMNYKKKTTRFFYWEFPEKGGQVAVLSGRWKGVKTNMKKDPASEWEIYDIETDIGEKKNIAAYHPELIIQFDAIVKKAHQHPAIREWEFIDPKF